MTITITSTTKVVNINSTVEARIWEGTTDTGIPVHCYVTRIGVAAAEDLSAFLRELEEHRAPSRDVGAIPLRVLL